MALAATAVATQQRPYTLDDIPNLLSDAGERYEIIGGELIVSPAPLTTHQEVASHLVWALESHVRGATLGRVYFAPTAVKLGEYDIVQPDIVFVSSDQRGLVRDGVINGAPGLVVEILSPSTQRTDLVRKRVLYEQAGVSEYWIVDIDRRVIRQLVLRDGRYDEIDTSNADLQSSVIDGLQIDIASVFHDLWQ